MNQIPSPLDDLRTLLTQLPTPDSCTAKKITPAMDERALSGGLVDYLLWLGAWQGKAEPALRDIHICLLASSYKHGVLSDEITRYIEKASKGRAPVNLLCVERGIGLRVLELAPTMPFEVTPANPDWSEQDCMAAVAFGMEASAAGGDLLGLSDLAFGNEANALALICAVMDKSPVALGVRNADLIQSVEQFLEEMPAKGGHDSLDFMRAFAGREIAALIGGIIAARSRRIPVLLDGIGALAAAVVLWRQDAGSIAHCKFAATPLAGLDGVLSEIGLMPVLSGVPGAGPGCAVAAAAGVLGAAVELQGVPAT